MVGAYHVCFIVSMTSDHDRILSNAADTSLVPV
jgi:hypothetical protein